VNYAHINSVLCDGETTFLMFHNQTTATGKKSELVRLDRELRVSGRRRLEAGCAHNVVLVDGRIGYGDSQSGDFVLGETRLKLGAFTRGVAVDEDRLFVGGSEFAARDKRGHSNGLLYCLNREATALSWKVRMPAVGGVYEVRLLGAADQSLSEWCRAQRDQGGLGLEDAFDAAVQPENMAAVAGVA
jgi:hypothetical protein